MTVSAGRQEQQQQQQQKRRHETMKMEMSPSLVIIISVRRNQTRAARGGGLCRSIKRSSASFSRHLSVTSELGCDWMGHIHRDPSCRIHSAALRCRVALVVLLLNGHLMLPPGQGANQQDAPVTWAGLFGVCFIWLQPAELMLVKKQSQTVSTGRPPADGPFIRRRWTHLITCEKPALI